MISALKQVANAATNAVHSATGNVTGHAHSNSGESAGASSKISFPFRGTPCAVPIKLTNPDNATVFGFLFFFLV